VRFWHHAIVQSYRIKPIVKFSEIWVM